jgi:Probable transposase.
VCERDHRSRQRRQNYADPDADVWEISEYRGRYGGTLGESTVQQIERKNREAWKSFFSLKEKGEANGKPGYWGNEDDGREIRTYIRNTSYTAGWGEYSRLEILVGQDLKDEYDLGYRERLRLEVRGDPNWKEYENQGRLELHYNEQSDQFRAFQPVTIDEDNSRLAQPQPANSTSTKAAICSSGSARRHARSPGCSRYSKTDSTAQSGFADSTADEPVDAIMRKPHCAAT